jgi:hypothetical protein
VKYHENPKSPPPTTSLLAVYLASTKKLIDKKCRHFIPLSESKRIFDNSLRCLRYHDFRDTPNLTYFSGILFGVTDCRICDFAPTPSLFPLFPMYQVPSVSIYKALYVYTHSYTHARPSLEKPVLLLLDNHGSHLSVERLNYAKANGILMLSFPPAHFS